MVKIVSEYNKYASVGANLRVVLKVYKSVLKRYGDGNKESLELEVW